MTVKHRGGAPAKPTIDLTKKAAPVMSKPPKAKLEPKQQQPRRRQYITAAPDGPPLVAELPEKLHKIEGRVHKPRTDKQAEILRRVTDLFMAGADNYSDEHVDLFDGVISRIAEKIETKARAELAHRRRRHRD